MDMIQNLMTNERDNISEFIQVANVRDEIVDNLWIGQFPSESYGGIKGFKFVICLNGAPLYNIAPHQTVIIAPFDDTSVLPPEDFLDNLAELASNFAYQGPTLVHCMAGINRSALVVTLALIKRGLSGSEAIELVRAKRGSALLSNETFSSFIEDKG